MHGRPIAGRPLIETFVHPIEAYALERAAAGARRILEVGSAFGFSSILMAQTGAEVLAVDPHTGYGSWEAFLANLNRYGVAGRVRPLRMLSEDALPSLAAHSFDLAFIDGDHSEEMAGHDIREALRLVRPGGLIAVHDYTERWPGVLAAVNLELAGLPRWRILSLYLAAL